MRFRSHFFPVLLVGLFSVLFSGSLVFAQDPKQSTDSQINTEYFVLIATKGNPLNVRQNPSALSPVIASLLNDSKVNMLSTTIFSPQLKFFSNFYG